MRFPFVDVFLVRNDETFTWALTSHAFKTVLFRSSDVFPLSWAPFEGFLAPVPRYSRTVLGRVYRDPNLCVSPGHDHRIGRRIDNVARVPCQELSHMYPVFRV